MTVYSKLLANWNSFAEAHDIEVESKTVNVREVPLSIGRVIPSYVVSKQGEQGVYDSLEKYGLQTVKLSLSVDSEDLHVRLSLKTVSELCSRWANFVQVNKLTETAPLELKSDNPATILVEVEVGMLTASFGSPNEFENRFVQSGLSVIKSDEQGAINTVRLILSLLREIND